MEDNKKVRVELWKAIEGITDELLNVVVEEGKWTIAQVLEHLYLTEKVIVRSFSRAQQISEDNPLKLKKVQAIVNRSQKINAPDYLLPTSEYQTLEQLKGKLEKSRESLERFIEEVSENHLKEKFMQHPIFGNLALYQWVEFLCYHEKRHIAQIEVLKEVLNK